MEVYPSPQSGPDEPGSLSPRERKILASIENDLSAADPALARRLARRLPTALVPFDKRCALVAGFLVLMVVAGLIPAGLTVLLVLLASVLLASWMLLRTVERQWPE